MKVVNIAEPMIKLQFKLPQTLINKSGFYPKDSIACPCFSAKRDQSIDEETREESTENIVNVLQSATKYTLPPKVNKEKECYLWKNDTTLNEFLKQRSTQQRNTSEYKVMTKKIKKHVRQLKNVKMKQEADEINAHATKREIEELFRCVKSYGSAFKNTKQSNKCDAEKLTKYFKEHQF